MRRGKKKNASDDAYCAHCCEKVPFEELKLSAKGYPLHAKCGKKVRIEPKYHSKKRARKVERVEK